MRRKRRQKKPSSGWKNLFVGLIIAGIFSGLIYLVFTTDKDDLISTDIQNISKEITQEIKEKIEKTIEETIVPSLPEFDFYDLLPSMEMKIPDIELFGKKKESAPTQKLDKNSAYILQTGSFRKHSDAEQLRAQLGFLGLEARIYTAVIDNDQTWHRVRLGPFHDLEELKAVRKQLNEQKISSLPLKIGNE